MGDQEMLQVANEEVQRGSLVKCFADGTHSPVTVVISSLKITGEATRRLTGHVTDTQTTIAAAFTGRLLTAHNDGKLVEKTVVTVNNYQVSEVNDDKKMMILDLEVKGKFTGDVPAVPQAISPPRTAQKPVPNADIPPVSPSEMPITPAPKPSSFQFQTPPSALQTSPMGFAVANNENAQKQAVTSSLHKVSGQQTHQPISSLNPYKSKFTIRAKVDAKQPLKNVNIKGDPTDILTLILVDSEGTQIEATFWRDMAAKMDKELQEGSVYYFSNGQLSGTNRRYSTTNNDYRINFNMNTEVKEAPDQDASRMHARCNFVKIDCLASKISKKLPVDIVGVVTDVGSLGSIKRQQDGTEFVRRDITLVDDSRKSVMVTLWRNQAEKVGAELEALDHPIVVMTKMRVGDYNGVSVSSTYASRFEINPTGYDEARSLQEWWDTEGNSTTFAPAGDSATRAGLTRLSKWQAIEAVVPERELSADDAPVYATLHCTVTKVPEEQNLYYMANPATNKKVEKNDMGKYMEVGTGAEAESMQRRYILNASVMDFTKQSLINLFNEQAAEMLGKTADELHVIKESGTEDMEKVLSGPSWSQWVLDVMAKPREYNGKTKMRVNVRSARKVDYAADSARLIQMINETWPQMAQQAA